MDLLAFLLGGLGFLGGLLWLSLAIMPNRWQAVVERNEAEARRLREEGYKVNVVAFFGWFTRTRFRAVLFACYLFATGAWFLSMAR